MKHSKFFPIICLVLFTGVINLFAQEEIHEDLNSGVFNFEEYNPKAEIGYSEIDQSKIHSVRLAYKEVHNTEKNEYLFYPSHVKENGMNLISLMMWGMEKSVLPAYEVWDLLNFSLENQGRNNPVISREKILDEHAYSIEDKILGKLYSPLEVTYYIILEATIYGKKGRALEVRPLAITPVKTSLRYDSDTIKEALFTLYFPDLMPILQYHSPAKKIRGMKNSLDYFTKGLYNGKNVSNLFFQYGVFDLDMIEADSMQTTVITDGIFVDPGMRIYQGTCEQEIVQGEAPPQPTPDMSQVAYAKFYRHNIDLKEKGNWPLYLPTSNILNLKNIQGLLMQGLNEGLYVGYDIEEDRILSKHEIDERMYEKVVFQSYDDAGEELKEEMSFPYRMEKLMVAELVFFDFNGQIIFQEAIEVMPLVTDNEMYDSPRYMSTCRILLTDAGFRQHLHESKTIGFNASGVKSYLSFFDNRKYTSESTWIEPISVKEAARMLGTDFWKEKRHAQKTPSITPVQSGNLKIVFREISLNDDETGSDHYEVIDRILYNNGGKVSEETGDLPVNYQVFFPQYEYNGLKPLWDLIKERSLEGDVLIYEFNREGSFDYELGLKEVREIVSHSDTIIGINYEAETDEWGEDAFATTVVEEDIAASFVQKFLLMELQDDERVIPVAIAADISEFERYNDPFSEVQEKYAFWVPLSSSFRDALMDQELLKLDKGKLSTYYDLFFNGGYSGKVDSEKPISKEEANRLIEFLNR